jgi:hypothetical protein
MHRAKRPELFAGPKVLVQRLRGPSPVRAWLDEEGLIAGHTLTVVRPTGPSVSAAAIHALVTSPLVGGLLRLEHGRRLDLYPRDVRRIPLPRAWLGGSSAPLEAAWGLSAAEASRLLDLAG